MNAEEVLDFIAEVFPQYRIPTLMAIADTGMYCLTLAMVGRVALALTTNLNIDFPRAPKLADIIAETEMLKLGKRLAVGRVTIYSEGMEEPVAHASVTYSIPPESERPRQ
jgi:acyl-coenzyme A thioesterase PaaI-like protein